MDKIQEWLATPLGIAVSKHVATLVKGLLTLISTQMPSLGLGPEIDSIVSILTPMVMLFLCQLWTATQNKKTEKRVRKALMTPPPSSIPLE